jgi:hypothetical protein
VELALLERDRGQYVLQRHLRDGQADGAGVFQADVKLLIPWGELRLSPFRDAQHRRTPRWQATRRLQTGLGPHGEAGNLLIFRFQTICAAGNLRSSRP